MRLFVLDLNFYTKLLHYHFEARKPYGESEAEVGSDFRTQNICQAPKELMDNHKIARFRHQFGILCSSFIELGFHFLYHFSLFYVRQIHLRFFTYYIVRSLTSTASEYVEGQLSRRIITPKKKIMHDPHPSSYLSVH